MWFLNDKAVAGKLYLRRKILRWLSASAYFVLVGTGRLHAGEAKPFSPAEWEKTVEAAEKEGKVVVVVGLSYYTFLPFTKTGLPVKSISIPRDEIYVSGGSGNVAMIKGTPHPNAAKVFVNWFLGPEGRETYSRAMGQASLRLDVDTQWTKEFGIIAAKDSLTREQYIQLENQSEEKILKTREAATELARKLLD
jgi:ABC-type Fe3+ transport system substrate-binding protein